MPLRGTLDINKARRAGYGVHTTFVQNQYTTELIKSIKE